MISQNEGATNFAEENTSTANAGIYECLNVVGTLPTRTLAISNDNLCRAGKRDDILTARRIMPFSEIAWLAASEFKFGCLFALYKHRRAFIRRQLLKVRLTIRAAIQSDQHD